MLFFTSNNLPVLKHGTLCSEGFKGNNFGQESIFSNMRESVYKFGKMTVFSRNTKLEKDITCKVIEPLVLHAGTKCMYYFGIFADKIQA